MTKSQIAFRRRRGFAYLWAPGMWLAHPDAPSVLSLALPDRIRSRRFKQVVHPSPGVWMHHLELHAAADIDDEVVSFLRRAYDAAGDPPQLSASAGRPVRQFVSRSLPKRAQ